MEHERVSNTSCNCGAWYSHKSSGTGTGRLRNNMTSEDHLNYSIVEIGQEY